MIRGVWIKKGLRILSLWLPVIIQMGLIFFFSAQPKGSPVLETFPLPAGIGHMAGYALLAVLLYRAVNGSFVGWNWRAVSYAFLLALIYAVSDEIHQVFVPGRNASVIDVIIDMVGAMIGLALVKIAQRMIFHKEQFRKS